MLLPYETTMNLFLTAVPIYEWEPDPQAADANAAAAATADVSASESSAQATTSLPPPLKLVFKGVRWVAVPVWGMRENPAWDQIAQDKRDQDERNNLERGRRRPVAAEDTPPADDELASGKAEDK